MVQLINLNKYYAKGRPDEVHALKNVNLTISAGDLIGVTGPSGSGKSTLLHILAGIDAPTSGSYLLDDIDMTKASDAQKAKLRNSFFGIVLQDFGLLGDQTAAENVKLPMQIAGLHGKTAEGKARQALEKVGIGDLAEKRVNQLSGGQKQRVAIARALAMEARLILADEPTGALDSETAAELMALIKELNRGGITFLIVTHNAFISDACERRLRIVDGVLKEQC